MNCHIYAVASAALLILNASTCFGQIDVVELTIGELNTGYEKGIYTSVEVTQAFLDRIDGFELNYNAFTNLNPNALADAAELDEERQTRGPRGPLHGVPVVIKEAIDVEGLPSTFGLAALSSQAGGTDLIAAQDATVVQRLRDAGAIILGKTNIPGMSLDGTRTTNTFIDGWDGHTFNAYDRDLAPGASSAGSATAVSANFAMFGLAEETGGSIQNPAGAQGVVGIKPTFGLVPNTGVMPLAGSTRDVVGPVARTVWDAAVALDVLAGATSDDPKTSVAEGNVPDGGYTSLLSTSALQGKRIGLYGPGWSLQSPSRETRELYEAAQQTLIDEGAILVEDPFAGSGIRELPVKIFGGLADFRGHESIVFDMEQYLDRLFGEDSPESTSIDRLRNETSVNLFDEGGVVRILVNEFEVALDSLDDPEVTPDLSEFTAVQDAYRQTFSAVLAEHHLDALVFPQMLTRTPNLNSSSNIAASSVEAINILGTPGVNVPAGFYDNGAPFSLMFMGDLFSEAELLSIAYDYEQATLHRDLAPPELQHVADTNGDGLVDFSDFLILADNFGKRRTGTHRGDFNGDRNVDFEDFLFFADHFGFGTEEVAAVPEPTSLGQVIAVALLLLCSRRRSPHKERNNPSIHPCLSCR